LIVQGRERRVFEREIHTLRKTLSDRREKTDRDRYFREKYIE
jgi:hypothetical protein